MYIVVIGGIAYVMKDGKYRTLYKGDNEMIPIIYDSVKLLYKQGLVTGQT